MVNSRFPQGFRDNGTYLSTLQSLINIMNINGDSIFGKLEKLKYCREMVKKAAQLTIAVDKKELIQTPSEVESPNTVQRKMQWKQVFTKSNAELFMLSDKHFYELKRMSFIAMEMHGDGYKLASYAEILEAKEDLEPNTIPIESKRYKQVVITLDINDFCSECETEKEFEILIQELKRILNATEVQSNFNYTEAKAFDEKMNTLRKALKRENFYGWWINSHFENVSFVLRVNESVDPLEATRLLLAAGLEHHTFFGHFQKQTNNEKGFTVEIPYDWSFNQEEKEFINTESLSIRTNRTDDSPYIPCSNEETDFIFNMLVVGNRFPKEQFEVMLNVAKHLKARFGGTLQTLQCTPFDQNSEISKIQYIEEAMEIAGFVCGIDEF